MSGSNSILQHVTTIHIWDKKDIELYRIGSGFKSHYVIADLDGLAVVPATYYRGPFASHDVGVFFPLGGKNVDGQTAGGITMPNVTVSGRGGNTVVKASYPGDVDKDVKEKYELGNFAAFCVEVRRRALKAEERTGFDVMVLFSDSRWTIGWIRFMNQDEREVEIDFSSRVELLERLDSIGTNW